MSLLRSINMARVRLFFMGLFGSTKDLFKSFGGSVDRISSWVVDSIAPIAMFILLSFPALDQEDAILKMINAIDSVVAEIAGILGLKPDEETAEELGAMAEQSDKKIEDFESTEKYIVYLRNEVKFDREKFEKMSAEEKLDHSTIGVSLYARHIEEIIGVALPPEFLQIAGQMRMGAEEIIAYMYGFKENGLSDMKNMSDFLTGKLDEAISLKAEAAIMAGLRKIDSGMNKMDIQLKLGDMKEAALAAEEI